MDLILDESANMATHEYEVGHLHGFGTTARNLGFILDKAVREMQSSHPNAYLHKTVSVTGTKFQIRGPEHKLQSTRELVRSQYLDLFHA